MFMFMNVGHAPHTRFYVLVVVVLATQCLLGVRGISSTSNTIGDANGEHRSRSSNHSQPSWFRARGSKFRPLLSSGYDGNHRRKAALDASPAGGGTSADAAWYFGFNITERRDILLGALKVLSGGSEGQSSNVSEADEWCASVPQNGGTSAPWSGLWRFRKAHRRPKLRWFLLPSSPIHVCLHTGMLVQSMQRNYKSVCSADDVFNDETVGQIENEVMPRLTSWIQQSLLVPEVEIRPSNGRRTHRLKPDSNLGICAGQLGPYIPRTHDGTVRGNIGPVNPYNSQYIYPHSVTSNSGASDTSLGVRANTTIPSDRGAFTNSRGTFGIVHHGATTAASADVDVVIYVTTMFSFYYYDAVPCQFHPVTGRPTVVHLNIDPALLRLSFGVPEGAPQYVVYELASRYLLRDVVQALALKNFFLDLNPTQFTRRSTTPNSTTSRPQEQMMQDEVLVKVRRPEGYTYNALIREPLRSITQAQFGCNTVNETLLEAINDVYYTTSDQNLAGRLFAFELLTYDNLDLIISDRLLGVMQSNNFWDVDWGTPVREQNMFGFQMGCSFVSKLCNESSGRLLPNGAQFVDRPELRIFVSNAVAATFTVPPNGGVNETAIRQWAAESLLSNESSLAETPFCFLDDGTNLTTALCHSQRRGVAQCNVETYNNVLPTNLQYFPQSNMGGAFSRLLFCPVVENNFLSCDEVITKLVGLTSGVYHDMYCLDRVAMFLYNVSWANGSTTWPVWKRIGSGCFRITGCNPSDETFDVRIPDPSSSPPSWPIIRRCSRASILGEPFDVGGIYNGSFLCAPFAAVCGTYYQQNPLLLSRRSLSADDPPLDSAGADFPSMSPRRFSLLDISTMPTPTALGNNGTRWWAAATVEEQYAIVANLSRTAGWATSNDESSSTTVVNVPVSVHFALPTSAAAPLGGLLVVLLPCDHPITCGSSSSSGEWVPMDCWHNETTCTAPGYVMSPKNQSTQQCNDDGGGSMWVFFVDQAIDAETVTSTVSASCRYLDTGDNQVPHFGDPGEYLEVSFYALHPAFVVLNESTGLYEAPPTLLPDNRTDFLERVRSSIMGATSAVAGDWLAPAADPYCGSPLSQTTTDGVTRGNGSVLSLQHVAAWYHFNAPSDDIAPLLPMSWFAGVDQTTPNAADLRLDGISSVLGDLLNLSVYLDAITRGNISRADASMMTIALDDDGTVTPNTTATIRGIAYAANATVVTIGLASLVAAASDAPTYGLSFSGPAAPWWEVMPIEGAALLEDAQTRCNVSLGFAMPMKNLSSVERTVFATASPCEILITVPMQFYNCEVSDDAPAGVLYASVDVALVDNFVSSFGACTAGGWNGVAHPVPLIVAPLPKPVATRATALRCQSLQVEVASLSPVLLSGAGSGSVLAPQSVTVLQQLPNGTWAGALSVAPAVPLFATATKQSEYLLQLVYSASCSSCNTSLYFTFVLPGLAVPSQGVSTHSGFTIGDRIVLRMDNTQYQRNLMLRHPWWNSTNTVLLGCPGDMRLQATRWEGEQVQLRVVGNTTAPCVPRNGRVGVITDGYVSVAGFPTQAPPVASFHVVLRNRSAIYRTSVSDVQVLTSCARCNQRGVCVGTSECSCFVGYGGPACTVCASQAMDAAPNGRCDFFCDRKGASVPASFPPRYVLWIDECVAIGGYLDPQAECRCVCNGTFCLYPTRTESVSLTQTVEISSTAPLNSSTPSGTPSGSPVPSGSRTPSPLPTATANTPSTSPTTTGGPDVTTSSPLATSTGSLSPHSSSSPSGTSSVPPTGLSSTASPATVVPTGETVSPSPPHTSGTGTTTIPGSTTPSTTGPAATPTGLQTPTPSGWTPSPTTASPSGAWSPSPSPHPSATVDPTPSPSPHPSATVDPTPSPNAGTPTSSILVSPTTAGPFTDTPLSTVSSTAPATSTAAPTLLPATNHSLTLSVSLTETFSAVISVENSSSASMTPSEGQYPDQPVLEEVTRLIPVTVAPSPRDFGRVFRGDAELVVALIGNSFILQSYFDDPTLVPADQLLAEVQSPFEMSTVTVRATTVVFSFRPLAYRMELLSHALVPIFRIENSICAARYAADVPRDAWNSSWNSTGNASMSPWLAVPIADARYGMDLYAYGPVFRQCFNAVLSPGLQYYSATMTWIDSRTLIFYLVVDPKVALDAAPSSTDAVDVLDVLHPMQRAHAVLTIVVFIVMLDVSPHLLLDVQLGALLGAVSWRTPGACVLGDPTTVFSYVLAPNPLTAVLLPLSWLHRFARSSLEHLRDFWIHTMGMLGVCVLYFIVQLVSLATDWSDVIGGAKGSTRISLARKRLFEPQKWMRMSWFAAGVFPTGLVFSAVSALRVAASDDFVLSESDEYATLCMIAVAAAGMALLCWMLGRAASLAIPSLDPLSPQYSTTAALTKVRMDKRATATLHRELHRAPARTLLWSKRLAVCVSVWFPPQWLLPRGYWTFHDNALAWFMSSLHRYPKEHRLRERLTRWVPLLHLVRNVVVALLLGVSGSETPCWTPSISTIVPTADMPTSGIGFDVGFALAAFLVACWTVFVVIVRPFRSVCVAILDVILCAAFIIVGAVFLVHGTFPRGGVFSLSEVGSTTESDDSPLNLVTLLLAFDAIILLMALLVWFEQNVLDDYIEEVDRAVQSQFRHSDALEACFLEVPLFDDGARADFDDPLELSVVSLTQPYCPPPVAAFSPLDALRKMVEADAPAKPKAKRRRKRKNVRLRREDSCSSTDDGTTSSSSRSADEDVPVPMNPLEESPQQKRRPQQRQRKSSEMKKKEAKGSSADNFDALEALLFRNDPLPPVNEANRGGFLVAPPLDRTAAANLWKR